MAWESINNGWDSINSPLRVKVKSNYAVSTLRRIRYKLNNNYSFISGRTYQYVTNVWGYLNSSTPNAASFSVSTPWNDYIEYGAHKGTTSSVLNVSVPGWTNSNYYFYSRPSEDTSSAIVVTYTANPNFGLSALPYKEGITNFKFSELNFFIQGFAFYKWGSSPYSAYNSSFPTYPKNSLGWTYDPNFENGELFHWYDHSNITLFPVGGQNNRAELGYRQNNYIAQFVPYSHFNLRFNYQNEGDFPLEVWLTSSLPNSNPGSFSMPINSRLLCKFGDSLSGTYSSTEYSIEHAFYSLQGFKYVLFKAPFVGTQSSPTYSNIFITNIKIEGGYHPGNNLQYLTTDSDYFYNPTSLIPIGLTGATYSALIGGGNTVNATYSISISQIFANIGNGLFKSGIWENGVWNSGWRYDDSVYEFYKVSQYFNYNYNKRWRVEIQGPIESVNYFQVGDKVSVSNIIAIDINEERKVIKNYYTIIGKNSDTIIIEFDSDFPLRRIEKDSVNHRIYVTKNVWLSGAFLNGYFKGIWNSGLFKGYPLITEMVDSHWIDGTFDGGHFKSTYYQIPKFTDTLFYLETFGGKMGLTFSSKHNLTVGDIITIDKDDKTINPEYDGESTVQRVINDYHIVTNKDWGSDSFSEGGTVSVVLSKGLIQKIRFNSLNNSKITSNQSLESITVFQYNSWMDLNYNSESAVNIGKPITLLNEASQKEYSENNLYGYPTSDILESISYFRDSYTNIVRPYSLGSKYKIFHDYIGEAGEFKNKFGPTGIGELFFNNYGWTYSRFDGGTFTFSRTESAGDNEILGEELRIETTGKGGVLDIYPISNDKFAGRTNEEIQRNRYTLVEFDLVTFSAGAYLYFGSAIPSLDGGTKKSLFPKGSSKGLYASPTLHFNNLNITTRNVYYGSSVGTASTIIPASYLPIYSNVVHTITKKRKKVEYFFNKTNLAMHFLGNDSISNINKVEYVVDNLHFYEVDMVPFFKYFVESNINKGIEIPFQGVAPFINYQDVSFNFIDSIIFGEDSIQFVNATSPIGGVGSSIGVAPPTGTIFNPETGFPNQVESAE